MNRKAYILTFDAPAPIIGAFDAVKLHKALTTAKGILSWWHYLKGTYLLIVDSKVSAANISAFVQPFFETSPYLIVEVDLLNHDGILNPKAWDWIRANMWDT